MDHAILLQQSEAAFGMTGTVLDCICSFHTNLTQQVAYCDQLSSVRPILFGVPQGSVLWPIAVRAVHLCAPSYRRTPCLQLHQYADDCQVYLSTPVEDVPHAVDKFSMCLADVNVWLRASQLQLNARKMQWCGVDQPSCLTRLPAKMSWCLAHASPFLKQIATLVSSLTVSCRWQRMPHLSVDPATISYASSYKWSAHCPCTPLKC